MSRDHEGLLEPHIVPVLRCWADDHGDLHTRVGSHLFEELRDLQLAWKIVRCVQVKLERLVRTIAGFGEQFLGALYIARRNLFSPCEWGDGWDRIVVTDYAIAQPDRVHDLFAVNHLLERLAHADVVEWGRIRPHDQD